MDGDPAEEPALDSLSLTLPLPFRVGLIILLGILNTHAKRKLVLTKNIAVWAWGANLQYLSAAKIVRHLCNPQHLLF